MSGSPYVGTASPREESARRAAALAYGQDRVNPDVFTPERINRFWDEEFRTRLHSDKDAVVLVDGPPGSGKSTQVIDRCRRLDPTFTPKTLPRRVAFHPADVALLYRSTPRYGAAWIDEAGSAGLLATDTFSQDQKNLVELINLIRARNVVLFIIIPDPGDLAKAFRARRADYRISCEEIPVGGTGAAWVARRVRGRKYFLDDGRWLGFSDEKVMNPVAWPDYRSSRDPTLAAFWAAYWPLKLAFMDRRVNTLHTRMQERRAKGE